MNENLKTRLFTIAAITLAAMVFLSCLVTLFIMLDIVFTVQGF